MGFLNVLKVDFVPGSKRMILETPFRYYDKELDLFIEAPAGFYTDGASIPRPFWTLVGHPWGKKVREAAVIHDYLYYSGLVSRADADRIFREAMAVLGASRVQRWTYWSAVRVGAGLTWQKYRKNDKESYNERSTV